MNFKRFHESKNLFDKNTTPVSLYYQTTREVITQTAGVVSIIMPVSPNTTYTFNNPTGNRNRICETETVPEIDDTVINYIASDGNVSITLTTSNNTHYILWWVGYQQTYSDIEDTLSVNLGSTPQPYEPYSSEVWHDTPHYVHKTDTDTITLPADIYANAVTATVGLKGQMEQSGTPTPTTPIQPSECGERTAQLFDYQAGTPTAYKYLDENGNENEVAESAPWYITDYIPIPDGVLSVTLSKIGGGVPAMCAYDASKNYITGIKYNTGSAVTKVDITLTSSTPICFIRFSYFLGNTGYDDLSTKMLNTGNTPLPYEPYGYKIPISSANTTTPVYLGEVQSTRRIKKLVLTGEEDIEIKSGNAKWYIPIADMRTPANIGVIAWYCSHYQAVANNASWTSYDYMISWSSADIGADRGLRIRDINFLSSSLADFKAYLAQQYSAGTPVCVWYVLANPETAVVNEPLRKIGTYADEVSGITIPTTAGANTISVGTTLQPSEVSVNYHGWHPVADVHERENGAWT